MMRLAILGFLVISGCLAQPADNQFRMSDPLIMEETVSYPIKKIEEPKAKSVDIIPVKKIDSPIVKIEPEIIENKFEGQSMEAIMTEDKIPVVKIGGRDIFLSSRSLEEIESILEMEEDKGRILPIVVLNANLPDFPEFPTISDLPTLPDFPTFTDIIEKAKTPIDALIDKVESLTGEILELKQSLMDLTTAQLRRDSSETKTKI